MSLINEVLRDLEANRPNDPVRQNLQREIRALPAPGASHRGRRFVAWASLVLVLGVAAFWLLPFLPVTPRPVSPPVAVAPAKNLALMPIPDSLLAAVAPLPVIQSPTVKPVGQPAVKQLVPGGAARTPDPAATPVAASEAPQKVEKKPSQHVLRDPVELALHKAEAATAEGRPEEAAAVLLQALEQDRRSVPLRQALVRSLLAQKRFDEAMQRLSIGLNLMPEQTGWALMLARLYLDRNDLAAAVRTLDNSRAYATNHADYVGFFAYLKARQGEQREAGAYYLQAARLAPQEGRWWLGLGLALAADGKTVEAREAMRRALASGTLSADLRQLAEQHVPAAAAGN